MRGDEEWSPIVESWPMWLPLQRITLFPIRTNGWITFSSKTKQLSPSSSSPRRGLRAHVADELVALLLALLVHLAARLRFTPTKPIATNIAYSVRRVRLHPLERARPAARRASSASM